MPSTLEVAARKAAAALVRQGRLRPEQAEPTVARILAGPPTRKAPPTESHEQFMRRTYPQVAVTAPPPAQPVRAARTAAPAAAAPDTGADHEAAFARAFPREARKLGRPAARLDLTARQGPGQRDFTWS